MSDPQERGWGSPGKVPLTTIRRTDGVALSMHTRLADLTSMLLDLTELTGYDLRPGECWGYNARKIAGSSAWSHHAWGVAIDLNAPSNWRGSPGDIPPAVVSLWKDHGWTWGGHWANTDPMHFEFFGTPSDAERITARLRAFLGGPTPLPPPLQEDETMRMLIDKRNDVVWLFGSGEPKNLGGRPDLYNRLLALGIPSTPDDGALIDFLRS